MRAAEVWAAICDALSELYLFGQLATWRVEAGSGEAEASGYTLRWWQDLDGGRCGDIASPGREWLLHAKYSSPPRQLYLCWNPWEGG